MTAAAAEVRQPHMHGYGHTQIYTKYPVAEICTISLLLLTLFSNSHFSLSCAHTHSRETNSHLPFHLLLFNDAEWHSQDQSPAYPLHSAAPQVLSSFQLCVDTVGFFFFNDI